MARVRRATRASRRCRHRRFHRVAECERKQSASPNVAVSGIGGAPASQTVCPGAVEPAREATSPRAVTFAPDVPEEEPRFVGRRPRAYTCYDLEELLGGGAADVQSVIDAPAAAEKAPEQAAAELAVVTDMFCQEPAPSELSTEEPASEAEDNWEEPAPQRRPRFSNASDDDAEEPSLQRRPRFSSSWDDTAEQEPLPVRRVRFCEPEDDGTGRGAKEEAELVGRARPRALTEHNLEEMVAGYEARRRAALEAGSEGFFDDL